MDQGNRREKFEIDQLLHPARAFERPSQVVNDIDLTLNEKRAILASWASDACAVEASPELRETPDGALVKYDEIMEALRMLDGEAAKKTDYGRLMKRARRIRDLYRPGGGGQLAFG
ncbi:MAG: hypothetical protein JO245_09165 [Pseudolabrys sp.]|nr:hypothetical protein [Pseudolabrys sp.]